MTDKIHLPDGSTHFIPGTNQAGKTIAATGAQRSAFLISQLEAQVAKTQTAAKFLAMKLDAIAKARLAFARAPDDPTDTSDALDKFLAVIDEQLTNMEMPKA